MADPHEDPLAHEAETRAEMERLVSEAYERATDTHEPPRRPRPTMTRQRMVRLLVATAVLVVTWDGYMLTRPVEILDPRAELENMSFAVVTAALAVESFQDTYGRLPRNLEEVQMQEWDLRYWPRADEFELTAESERLMVIFRSGDDLDALAQAAGIQAVRR